MSDSLQLEFKPEDFIKLLRREKFASPSDLADQLARLVNRRLLEMLAEAPAIIFNGAVK